MVTQMAFGNYHIFLELDALQCCSYKFQIVVLYLLIIERFKLRKALKFTLAKFKLFLTGKTLPLY